VPQSTRRPVSRLRKRVQQVLRVGKRTCVYLGFGLVALWLACAALRPVLLDHDEVTDIRHLTQEVSAAEQYNEKLRRRIHTLQTRQGIEVEARKAGWTHPDEILIQTSETPPPPPAQAPAEKPKAPPLGAVRRGDGLFDRALDLASRALHHRRPPEP